MPADIAETILSDLFGEKQAAKLGPKWRRLAAFAYNAGRIAELERACSPPPEDAESSWAADSIDVGYRVLSDKWVSIRKARDCDRCGAECDPGARMHVKAYTVDGGFVSEYECDAHDGEGTDASCLRREGGSRSDLVPF